MKLPGTALCCSCMSYHCFWEQSHLRFLYSGSCREQWVCLSACTFLDNPNLLFFPLELWWRFAQETGKNNFIKQWGTINRWTANWYCSQTITLCSLKFEKLSSTFFPQHFKKSKVKFLILKTKARSTIFHFTVYEWMKRKKYLFLT